MECLVQGRALEEIDAIFEVAYNPFRSTDIHYADAERRVGQLEREKELVISISGENNTLTRDSKQEVICT